MSIKKSFLAEKGVYKVTFSLPIAATKGKSNVRLLGDFNNWDSAKGNVMKAGKDEYSTSIELKPGTYEFRYLIDNLTWENDYSADNYISSPFTGINNSVLHLPSVAQKSVAKKGASAKPTVAKVKSTPVKKVAVTAVKEEKKIAKPVIKSAAKPTKTVVKAAPKAEAKPQTASVVKTASKPVVKKATKSTKK